MKWVVWGWLAAAWGILPVVAGQDSNVSLSDLALSRDSNAPGLSDDRPPAMELPTGTIDDYRASPTALPLDLTLGADLRLRQAATSTSSDRFTTVEVAAATKTETLLPVIGPDGQMVTPVVVPTSAGGTGTPAASVSIVTAEPVTVTATAQGATVTQTAQGATITQTAEATITQAVTVTQAGAGPAPAVTVTQSETITAPGTTETIIMTMTAAVAPQAMSTALPAGNPGGAAATQGASPQVQREIDPADGPFLGGTPVSNVDLPITLIFLALFAIGAFTHISIYRANAKRGHKFLLSDLVFDFCMIRSVTCIFRIIWTFISPRGVILVALIVENGGAVVLFVVQIFFTQRIIRAMHPHFGWHPAFRIFTLILAFSVPAVIVLNIISLSLTFFSVGNEQRLDTLEKLLQFGASWNMMLAVYPLVAIILAAFIPGPRVERFGSGPFRVKIAIVAFAAVALGTGQAIRLATAVNPIAPGTEDSSTLFGKATFYTTGFMLEIFVVILFAIARVDLRFHVPNGTTGPGDYSKGFNFDSDGKPLVTKEKLEGMIGGMRVPYQLFDSPEQLTAGHDPDKKPLYAVLYPGPERLPQQQWDAASQSSAGRSSPSQSSSFGNTGSIPPRPDRVSRRASVAEAFGAIKNLPRTPSRQLPRLEKTYSNNAWDFQELYESNGDGAFQEVSDEKRPAAAVEYR